MTQLAELTTYIEQHVPIRANISFYSEMDNIQLTNAAKSLGNGGRRIRVRQYDAVLTWEAWPYRLVNPDVLFAIIDSWLVHHANSLRDELALADPSIDVEVDDQGDAWLQITIPLADPIVIVEDVAGDIPYGTKRYRLDKADIWVADHCNIHPRTQSD
ncbi:phage tail protein [Plesiomonas shigelloides]|uniref:phage tail protein n=1 Tax=Plesiomonas shigelloides TaxID=703 RepID=UPI0012622E45|nr:phage tail protein [Plesiomonas shigelloides]KAB7715712.1 phage tail protein [Plesiomonas shigelloides]